MPRVMLQRPFRTNLGSFIPSNTDGAQAGVVHIPQTVIDKFGLPPSAKIVSGSGKTRTKGRREPDTFSEQLSDVQAAEDARTERERNDAVLGKILRGTKTRLPRRMVSLTADDLARLFVLEQGGANRSEWLDAIDAALTTKSAGSDEGEADEVEDDEDDE